MHPSPRACIGRRRGMYRQACGASPGRGVCLPALLSIMTLATVPSRPCLHGAVWYGVRCLDGHGVGRDRRGCGTSGGPGGCLIHGCWVRRPLVVGTGTPVCAGNCVRRVARGLLRLAGLVGSKQYRARRGHLRRRWGMALLLTVPVAVPLPTPRLPAFVHPRCSLLCARFRHTTSTHPPPTCCWCHSPCRQHNDESGRLLLPRVPVDCGGHAEEHHQRQQPTAAAVVPCCHEPAQYRLCACAWTG